MSPMSCIFSYLEKHYNHERRYLLLLTSSTLIVTSSKPLPSVCLLGISPHRKHMCTDGRTTSSRDPYLSGSVVLISPSIKLTTVRLAFC